MSRWISKFFGTRKSTASRSKPRRPGVEALESRWCPAVNVTLTGATLKITGDESANQVRILHDDAHNRIQIGDGVSAWTFDSSKVSTITADLKGSDDLLSYRTLSDLGRNTTLQINLGSGNDALEMEVGNVAGARLTCQADLGLGDDAANVQVKGVLRGSANASFQVNGAAGNDRLVFLADNGQHAGATLKADYDGGDGSDNIQMTFDDVVTGKVQLLAHGGKGDDAVQIDAHARAGSTGSLYVPIRTRAATT
jgi:hypothetical protein